MDKLDFSKLFVTVKSDSGIFRIPFKEWFERMGENALSTPLGGTGNDTTLEYDGKPAEWRNGQIFLQGEIKDNQGPSGTAFGFNVDQYDLNGNKLSSYFQPQERSDGWIADNMETWGPLVVAAAAGLGNSGWFNQFMSPELLNSMPYSEIFPNFGADLALPEYGSAAAEQGFNLAADSFGADLGGMFDSTAIDALTGTGLGSAPNTGVVATQGGLGGAVGTATTASGASPTTGMLSEGAKALAESLGLSGASASGLISALVNAYGANKTTGLLDDLTNSITDTYKDAIEDVPSTLPTGVTPPNFKPYNIKSDFSSYKDGVASVDPVIQNLLYRSNKAATQSWDAVNSYSPNDMASIEFNDTMALLEPKLRAQQLALEARMAKQGRLGLTQSNGMFNPASGGGAAPELLALQDQQQALMLKAAQDARATSLARRGMLVEQANSTMTPMFTTWGQTSKDIAEGNATGARAATIDSDTYGKQLQYLSNLLQSKNSLTGDYLRARTGALSNATDAKAATTQAWTNAGSTLLGQLASNLFK